MERLQKFVQVDDEYVGCAKRMQYIEIDFNREICLCYTLRGTLYNMARSQTQGNFCWAISVQNDRITIWKTRPSCDSPADACSAREPMSE
jgi:hypothetical protein